jgi:hypothetical protein
MMKRWLLSAGALALIWWLGSFLQAWLWTSPDQHLRATQEKLIRAAERRDWDEVRAWMMDSYCDSTGADPEGSVEMAREALAGFFILEIQHEVKAVELHGSEAGTLRCTMRLEGKGGGVSDLVVATVNSMNAPWEFDWVRVGRWPWDWKLQAMRHEELAARVRAAGAR